MSLLIQLTVVLAARSMETARVSLAPFAILSYTTAMYPTELSSTMNHRHPLSLKVFKPEPNQIKPCQICHNLIKGLAYMCEDSNFWVHPLCVLIKSKQSKDDDDVPSSSSGVGRRFVKEVAVGLGRVAIGLMKIWIHDTFYVDEDCEEFTWCD
ncbi:hypothetical protein L1987_01361 [Smallanthus sonchifolius]|uniref:Uncharacterized protein n=1 Tax=Smallanthus sonchifolius TaxID=185202 RepID=A0ACB9K4X1_9ASTR|nr:hypothetical protein L1987_01361 [Smallanthus sonchifolius]